MELQAFVGLVGRHNESSVQRGQICGQQLPQMQLQCEALMDGGSAKQF